MTNELRNLPSHMVLFSFVILTVATPIFAAARQVHRDLPYAEPENERQTLDVYAPAEGKDHPVVVWIHGGGLSAGNKREVHRKPQTFVDNSFVFVSTNYRLMSRLMPGVTIEEIAEDFAKAIRWVHDHARDYGGDPNTIFVMGHSAGGQLAALVCTDDRYLKAEGLSFSIIKGCVPVDGRYSNLRIGLESITSPVKHVAKGKNIPPFLILHVASRPDSSVQSELFAKTLQEAGVSFKVVAAEGKNHETINSDLGLPDDKPTQAMWDFLDGAVKPKRTLNGFKEKLDATFTPEKAIKVFGKEDRNLGSGLILYEYDLDDGTKVRLGFPGLAKIVYAEHIKKDGVVEDIPLK